MYPLGYKQATSNPHLSSPGQKFGRVMQMPEDGNNDTERKVAGYRCFAVSCSPFPKHNPQALQLLRLHR